MSEANVRAWVVKALRSFHAVPVENVVCPGTPDVNFSGGWIEVKVDKWTKDGRLPLRHFRPEQKVWLRKRAETGEPCFVLVATDTTWHLLSPKIALECQGEDREWFLAFSLRNFQKKPSEQVFLDTIAELMECHGD